jgi:DNA-binding NtrC family response regulator
MTTKDLTLPGMIGRHPRMKEMYSLVRRAAQSNLPVLIVGETGTGKELVARALHQLGPFADGPLVDVNCAAIPETLAEAELFGWEKGAFTGAHQRAIGLLEAADQGTLFLDEACSLPLGIQAKLLRAIELQGFRRVGGRHTRSVEFRLAAAVSESVESLLCAQRFRADFAYRLAGITIELPPLRDRGADIRLLADSFLQDASGNGRPPKRLGESGLAALKDHSWPGNVRELKALMETLDLLVDGQVIEMQHVRPHLNHGSRQLNSSHIERALADCGWDVTRTARALGVGRTKLYRLMKEHGLRRPRSGCSQRSM